MDEKDKQKTKKQKGDKGRQETYDNAQCKLTRQADANGMPFEPKKAPGHTGCKEAEIDEGRGEIDQG